MNLAQYQQSQPPIQGTDAHGNLIDSGQYVDRGRRSEFMTMSTASNLGDLLEAAGIDATIAVTSEDQVNYKMAAGEKRLRYSYTIDTPEGPVTKPLGGLFATIYADDTNAKGKLYKRSQPDSSGNWVDFVPDPPAPPPPAPPNSTNTLFNAPFVGDAGAFTGGDRALLYRIAAALGVR